MAVAWVLILDLHQLKDTGFYSQDRIHIYSLFIYFPIVSLGFIKFSALKNKTLFYEHMKAQGKENWFKLGSWISSGFILFFLYILFE